MTDKKLSDKLQNLFIEIGGYEEKEAQLQKLKEFAEHKSLCELVSLAYTHIPVDKRKCTCGLDELLKLKSHE